MPKVAIGDSGSSIVWATIISGIALEGVYSRNLSVFDIDVTFMNGIIISAYRIFYSTSDKIVNAATYKFYGTPQNFAVNGNSILMQTSGANVNVKITPIRTYANYTLGWTSVGETLPDGAKQI